MGGAVFVVGERGQIVEERKERIEEALHHRFVERLFAPEMAEKARPANPDLIRDLRQRGPPVAAFREHLLGAVEDSIPVRTAGRIASAASSVAMARG